MQYEYAMPWQHVTPIRSSPKEKFLLNIHGVRIVGGNSHSSPWLALSDTTYSNMVSVPTENTTDIYMTYITTYPQVAHVRLTLHKQCYIRYENVFTSWARDHKTSLCPHILGARSWPVARQTRSPYHTIGKQNSSWGDVSRIHITQWEDTYILTLS
jgi:hypothetical protein